MGRNTDAVSTFTSLICLHSYKCSPVSHLSISHRESADKVVTDRGKYEELIVCSHEIAASTAQLVAASKVQSHVSDTHIDVKYLNQLIVSL